MSPFDQLLKEVQELKDRVSALEKENAELRAENSGLKVELENRNQLVDYLLRQIYGQKSEKYEDGDDPQQPLFPDLIIEGQDKPNPKPKNDSKHQPKKTYKKRVVFPEDIERERVEIGLSEDELVCNCGCNLEVIGESITEVLDYTPEKFKIIEEARLNYACPNKHTAKSAPAPLRILPKVTVSNSLLAQLVISKCLDRQPIYHLEKRWLSRHAVNIPRDSSCRWFIQLANKFEPLYSLIQDQPSEYDINSLDATPIQVLKEKGRKASVRSKVWCLLGGKPNKPVVIFKYCAEKHKQELNDMLDGFKGYIHGDVDTCYTSFDQTKITMSYCNAHSRRKFEKIARSTKNKDGVSHHVINEYRKLYQIEEKIRDLPPDKKKHYRQKYSKPILISLKKYLDEKLMKIPPKSLLGQAVNYTLSHWEGFVRFLEDGRLSIDNNHTERAIRQFVLARNNFVFADTPEGARALCIHFTIIQTAIANGLEPYDYYVYLCERIPYCKTFDDYEKLLPWVVKESFSCAA